MCQKLSNIYDDGLKPQSDHPSILVINIRPRIIDWEITSGFRTKFKYWGLKKLPTGIREAAETWYVRLDGAARHI